MTSNHHGILIHGVETQEQHHARLTCEQEYPELLRKHKIEFDARDDEFVV